MIMKRFNTVGLCIPEKDYMVDISEKLINKHSFLKALVQRQQMNG